MIDPGFESYQCLLWECVTCMPPPSANKACHSGFETQRIFPEASFVVSLFLFLPGVGRHRMVRAIRTKTNRFCGTSRDAESRRLLNSGNQCQISLP